MATVLVTGGAGGLGRAVVKTFREHGWRVVVPLERVGDLDDGQGVVTGVADLTDPDDVARIVRDATAEASEPLTALVNLVGGFAGDQHVAQTPLELFERQFALNLRPTYLVTQAVLPHLVARGDGAIVCTGSRVALQPVAGQAGYAASKAAVIAFAQTVAAEHRGDGVRCNAIVPTLIDTPANRAVFPPEEHHRLVAPERIARTIRFLCSDDAVAVTGAALVV